MADQAPRGRTARDGNPATAHGAVSLCLAAGAFVSTPFLILIPIAGFIPALLAVAGAVVAWIGLRRSERGSAVAVTGLIISVVLFGLLASVATLWNFVVVGPAVGDYQELQDVLRHLEDLVFGSAG